MMYNSNPLWIGWTRFLALSSAEYLSSPPLQRYVVAPDRPSLWNINSTFACFPDLISFDAIINCPRPREWLRVDTRTARSYLQFSFVNNKSWRRRGSDFNEGINNPVYTHGGRRDWDGNRKGYKMREWNLCRSGSVGESRPRSFGSWFYDVDCRV